MGANGTDRRMEICEALRLLRSQLDLSQTDAAKLEGAPHTRALSRWENGHRMPSMPLLREYLDGLGLDCCDFQDALNEVVGPAPTGCRAKIERLEQQLEQRLGEMERRLGWDEEPSH